MFIDISYPDYPSEGPKAVPDVNITPSAIVSDNPLGDCSSDNKDSPTGIDIPNSTPTHMTLPGTPSSTSNADGSSYSSTSSSRALLTSSSPPREDGTTTTSSAEEKTDTEDLSPLSE